MRIACLQFATLIGDIDNNLNRADAILSRANPQDLDLLVLPELAFTGYNFKSLQHISPYLEHKASGITSLWACITALKYECVVTVGYPEKVSGSEKWPASPKYYNSAITVNADGEMIANYRKTFLYSCDETWAFEGPDGFYNGEIPGLGNVAMGICMDLNPYKFESPWTAWEFAYHVLHKEANLVIISMAWLAKKDSGVYSRQSKEPDMDALSYWLARLEPIIRTEEIGEIIVVLANRCGSENEAVYTGTSCVLGIEDGEVKVYGILGSGEEELLVVDTTRLPQSKLISTPMEVSKQDTVQSRNAPTVLNPERSGGVGSSQGDDVLLSQNEAGYGEVLVADGKGDDVHHSAQPNEESSEEGEEEEEGGEEEQQAEDVQELSLVPLEPHALGPALCDTNLGASQQELGDHGESRETPTEPSRGPFSDSGYASMPFSTAPGIIKDAGTKRKFSRYETIVDVDEHIHDVAPVGSTPSLSNESLIGSNVQNSVFDLLLEVFIEDAILKPLFKVATEKMDRERAVKNLRDFIHGYCVLLGAQNPTITQSKAIQFLRHRSRAFAEQIYGYNNSDNAHLDDAEEFSRAREARQRMLENVQRLFDTNQECLFPDSVEDPSKDIDTDSQDDDIYNPNLDYIPEDILEIKAFFVEGEPMDNFRLGYRKFVHGEPLDDWNEKVRTQVEKSSAQRVNPSEVDAPVYQQVLLKDLVAKICFIPWDHVRTVRTVIQAPLAVTGRFKTRLESYTKQPWDWWPLQPLMKQLPDNRIRLEWECGCGQTRFVDAPKDAVDQCLKLIPPWSTLSSQSKLKTATQFAPQSAISPTSSAAITSGARVSPLIPPNIHSEGQATQEFSSSSLLTSTNSSNLSSSLTHRVPRPDSQSENCGTISMPPSEHVLFGINRGHEIRLTQIDKRKYPEDGKFFNQLKHEYGAKRGILRRWLALSQYHHCEFVEFEKPCYKKIIRRGKGYPHDIPQRLSIYRYRPMIKNPDWRDPPILEYEFYDRFYGCSNCMIAKAMTIHKCSHFCPATIDRLDRIPKRIEPFELETQGQEDAWGLHGVEYISAVRVVAFHIMALAGPLIFWGLWAWYWNHEADLQNASVPFFSMISFLSLFWALMKGN